MKLLAAIAIVVGSAAAALIAPIWAYSISLIVFGLPHVLVELRYVDERFAARLPRKTILWLGTALCGIVTARALGLLAVGSGADRLTLELLIGVALIAIAWPLLKKQRASPLALAAATALLLGIVYAPVTTLVTMALLHNLTPVGFLAERLRGSERRAAMGICLVVFVLIPSLILLTAPSATHLIGPLSVGHLDNHLPTFVPPALLGTSFADRLFAAAAYLQCMHYAVVLHVLPKLSGGTETPATVVAWPKPRIFMIAVAAIGLLATLGFAANFVDTRSVYSLFAAVHAWIEIPVLLIACAVAPTQHQTPVAAT